MVSSCPHCQTPIDAQPRATGRYTPNCMTCGCQFLLVVPADANATAEITQPPQAEQSSGPELTGQFTDPNLTTPPTSAGIPSKELDATSAQPLPSLAIESPDEVTDATGVFVAKKLVVPPERTAALPSESVPGVEATTDLGTDASKAPKSQAGDSPESSPEQLGGYELLKQLGAGGMGTVYLARQMSLHRFVALKVIHANWGRDPIFLARFLREARAAALLNHPNVVQIYDLGVDAGVYFFSMEFVEGQSLGDLLRVSGAIEPTVAVGYALQAARGLKSAHDHGMIHRDIKPDNLMLNTEGTVKVADLGLVKTRSMTVADDQPAPRSWVGSAKLETVTADVTRGGTAMGSPSYMSPEQCRDASTVDHRADIYSLGCSLYTMLSGRTVFLGKTAVEMLHMHLTDPPPALVTVATVVSRELSDIVAKTLAKDPADRYQSMDEFMTALTVCRTSRTPARRPRSRSLRLSRSRRA